MKHKMKSDISDPYKRQDFELISEEISIPLLYVILCSILVVF